MREYTELSCTEKAYDSALGVGKSINTPSTIGSLEETSTTVATGGAYLRPHQAVPRS